MKKLLALSLFALGAPQAMAAPAAAAKPVAQKPAPLKPEELTTVELKEQMPPHWVLVNDISFLHIADGRAYLIDADNGHFLGTIPGGMSHTGVAVSPDGRTAMVPGTYYSRGSRGTRTDVVTFFKTSDLMPGDEVEIPAKRIQSLPLPSTMPLTDDGRFLLVYNFTPEQSVSVVDTQARKLVGEFSTPGCGLMHMTGPRGFLMQCADGSLQAAGLDAGGAVHLGATTKPLFTADDPASDKPVRIGPSTWLFTTFAGDVAVIDGAGGQIAVKARWKLAGADESAWRPGGLQPLAYHAPSGRLFVLMHKGGAGTHKFPGEEIWVYDVASARRTARIALDQPASAVAVSGDDAPLLYTTLFGSGTLAVRDPGTGAVLRKVEGLGSDLTLIQPAPVAATAGGR